MENCVLLILKLATFDLEEWYNLCLLEPRLCFWTFPALSPQDFQTRGIALFITQQRMASK